MNRSDLFILVVSSSWVEGKAKPCMEINCGARSDPYSIIYTICSSLDWRDFVMSQSLFNVREALMKMRSYEQAKSTEFVF
ncbi:hypothetical protein [Priestia megaterium]|uniref:hypothetical protein n=2 Tax=Bacillaceae TaxID=186817 RepID=UPI0020799CF6|nr:hypothetical protein [Priestia megaterium]USL41308.1 hypothetical protein LIS78_20045 [Priestia megaterium]